MAQNRARQARTAVKRAMVINGGAAAGAESGRRAVTSGVNPARGRSGPRRSRAPRRRKNWSLSHPPTPPGLQRAAPRRAGGPPAAPCSIEINARAAVLNLAGLTARSAAASGRRRAPVVTSCKPSPPPACLRPPRPEPRPPCQRPLLQHMPSLVYAHVLPTKPVLNSAWVDPKARGRSTCNGKHKYIRACCQLAATASWAGGAPQQLLHAGGFGLGPKFRPTALLL